MTKRPTRKELENREREWRLRETLQVLNQPHRQGDNSGMTDPLGVFIRQNNCARECYDAGWEYAVMVYRWRQAKGIPNPTRLPEFEGSGAKLDNETQEAWEKKIDEWGKIIARCDTALKCAGFQGFSSARGLILDSVLPPEKVFGPVKRALHSLAIELGKFPF